MLGFQHLYAEVDDLDLLKQVIHMYFQHAIDSRSSTTMIGVLLWDPTIDEVPRLPWNIVSPPSIFPLMMIQEATNRDEPNRQDWYLLGKPPTYVLHPTKGYPALDQLLEQLQHYLTLHSALWDDAWQKQPKPDCDGSIGIGFSISAGHFSGPLVIGRSWMEYHK